MRLGTPDRHSGDLQALLHPIDIDLALACGLCAIKRNTPFAVFCRGR